MKFMQKTKKLKTLVKISLLSAACALGLGGSLAEFNQPSQAASTSLKNPTKKGEDVVWNCVYFGTDKTTDDPIKWRVLNRTGDTLLLLADKAVANRVYDYSTSGVSWQTSGIRTWLNGDFIHEKVQFPTEPIANEDGDKVFLLSSEDLQNESYGFINSTSKCVQDSEGVYGSWWLKDTATAFGKLSAAIISNNGEDGSQPIGSGSSCLVRPAIQISYNSASWETAESVNSNYDSVEEDAGEPIPHLFEFNAEEATCSEQELTLPEDGIVLYANGLKDNKNGTYNYKTHTLCTDITGSYSYSLDNGKLKSTTGKVLVAVSEDSSMPAIDKNKFVADDATRNASKIASASIKDGIITITAKSQPGSVYLHVADSANPEKNFASCLITVKSTPSNIYTYREEMGDYSSEAVKYTKAEIGVGESTKVYICPTYKLNNEINRIDSLEQKLEYEATVNNDYFEITPSLECAEEFIITAKDLKDNKKTTGKATIKCVQNGKKVDINLTAVNGVREITLGKSSENNDKLTYNAASSAFTLTSENTPVDGKLTETVSGTIDISTVVSSDNVPAFKGKYTMTDAPKITALGTATGYNSEKLQNYGSVVVEDKPNADQKKITASLLSSNKKIITVKAAKGTPVNTTSYFMLYYNNTDNGYVIFSVKAAVQTPEPANPETTDPDASEPENTNP